MRAVPKTEAGYRTVGRQLLKLRRARVTPYSYITDGTRWISKPDSWTDVDQMLEDARSSYRKALWRDQDVEVHVFTEKDAVSRVISPVTETLAEGTPGVHPGGIVIPGIAQRPSVAPAGPRANAPAACASRRRHSYRGDRRRH